MIRPCPTLAPDALGDALFSIDCRLDGLVEGGYAHLFAAGGMFQLVLTAALTIYIAIVAYGLLFGRLSLTIGAMAPKLITIGLVLTFATSWPAYQRVIFDVFTRGPDQIVSAFGGQSTGATAGFALRLQQAVDRLSDAADQVEAAESAQPVPAAGGASQFSIPPATRAAWCLRSAGFVLMLGSIGVLVISRVLLTALLAVGPVFIVLGLFPVTRGLLEGWLRTSLMFALAPMVTVLSGSLGLMMIEPMLAAVAADPTAMADGSQLPITLVLVALINGALMLMGLFATSKLSQGLRLGTGAPVAVPERAASAAGQPLAPAGTGHGGAADDRVGAVVGAVLREVHVGAPGQQASASDRSVLRVDLVAPGSAAGQRARGPRFHRSGLNSAGFSRSTRKGRSAT